MKNTIKGGKADRLSLEDIARKHSVFIGTIQKQLEIGIKVEHEHATDPKKAREIAMDHLAEFPDYYTRLNKMEKSAEKSLEAKECMGADASGSFESKLSMPIMKRDIQNFKLKSNEINEMDGIADMAYDAPIGTKKKDPLKLDGKPKSGSITGASTSGMIATKKGFPKFGGPKAKFVDIKPKCKKFPYCNQMSGLDNLTLSEIHGMKEAIQEAALKYGITVKQVEEIIIKESKQLTNKKSSR
jgi:hypothetical protein